MTEHKYILTDEGGSTPVRIQVKEKKCDTCGKTFYFETGTPSWCPYCQAYLPKYFCGITGEEKTIPEAYDVNLCPYHDNMQCAYCPDVDKR